MSISDAAVVEGNSGTRTLKLAVALSTPSGRTVKVGYATGDGWAPGDHTAKSGSSS